MSEKPQLIPSASVILLREQQNSLEVLLLKKNSKITFGGSWVFPGGRVDEQDLQTTSTLSYASERQTVKRECMEETGLAIDEDKLRLISRWITPVIRPKRFTTLFFLYDATGLSDEVIIDHGEIVDAQWTQVKQAIKQHQNKQLVLAGPAFVTLSQIQNLDSVGETSAMLTADEPQTYRPKIQLFDNGAISLYSNDDAYALLDAESTSDCPQMLDKIEQSERRQRLYMYKHKPWEYQEQS